jgi:hypothetical protein
MTHGSTARRYNCRADQLGVYLVLLSILSPALMGSLVSFLYRRYISLVTWNERSSNGGSFCLCCPSVSISCFCDFRLVILGLYKLCTTTRVQLCSTMS